MDRVVSDELKATDAVEQLSNYGFDEYYITKVFSSGSLGINKKLVPTRWSITAVDDQLGKAAIKQIKDYNIMDYAAYFGSHLGNYFLVMVFPENFSYELFELYVPSSGKIFEPMTDYESFNGRTNYASSTAGGYYAARLGVVQKLKSMKRQGSCLVIRFITDDYTNPLGVWVVREAVKDAMSNRPVTFSSKELLLKYALIIAKKKYGYDLNRILSVSRILKSLNQRHLSEFSG